MSPIEIDVQHRCGRPCLVKTSGRARQVSKGFSRSFVSPLSGVAENWTGRNCNKTNGQSRALHRSSLMLSIRAGWCERGAVSSAGRSKASRGARPESLAQERSAAGTEAGWRPERICSACLGLKRLALPMYQGVPEVTADACRFGLFQELVRVRRSEAGID